MAHVSKIDLHVRPSVAGESLPEGRLVRLIASGLHDDLPTARLAASGTRLNVYVAFAAPDNFARPTPSAMYTATRNANFYETSAWGNFTETDTFYRVGISTLEDPTMASGYVMLARRGGIYEVASGCVVTSSNLQVVGNLVKVSDDGTGRWEYTTVESSAIAKVVDWNPETQRYTFEFIG